MSAMELGLHPGEVVEPDPFDLDIRVIEVGDAAPMLVNITDDGCGSSCPKACATNAG
jgi:FxLD family lantipeptide